MSYFLPPENRLFVRKGIFAGLNRKARHLGVEGSIISVVEAQFQNAIIWLLLDIGLLLFVAPSVEGTKARSYQPTRYIC